MRELQVNTNGKHHGLNRFIETFNPRRSHEGERSGCPPMSPMGPIRIFLITFLGRFLTAPAIHWQYAYCYGNDVWRHQYQVMKPF